MIRRKTSHVGLNKSGRIDWDGPNGWLNKAVAFWAEKRFSGKFIGRMTGLTVGQVYSRCHKYGIKLLDTRNGEGADSQAVAKNYGAGTITGTRKKHIVDTYPNPDAEE